MAHSIGSRFTAESIDLLSTEEIHSTMGHYKLLVLELDDGVHGVNNKLWEKNGEIFSRGLFLRDSGSGKVTRHNRWSRSEDIW
jgi:hypothetical protein